MMVDILFTFGSDELHDNEAKMKLLKGREMRIEWDVRHLITLILVMGLGLGGCDDGDEELDTAGDTVDVERDVDVETVGYAFDYPEQHTTVTLPVVDVFLNDTMFLSDARKDLKLTDQELDSLRALSARSVSEMYARNREGGDTVERYSTRRAAEEGALEVRRILGDDRGDQFLAMIRDRWSRGPSSVAMEKASSDSSAGLSGRARSDSGSMVRRTMRGGQNMAGIPDDTRIVVNIPAFRMDLFSDGELRGSWEIAIGYPEFPLPTGMRRANRVIFNPTWTPPSESWVVESGDVRAGETIPGGSPKNPLGFVKIPIGLPSLIHSGKPQSWIGSFGSHGCVGLTNRQTVEFIKVLGEATGTKINDSLITHYRNNPKVTETIPLEITVPVELRYESIAVVDGDLVIYRDVYDYNTNTEENLRTVLRSWGVDMASLDDTTRRKLTDGLKAMALDAQGQSDSEDPRGGDTAATRQEKVDVTRSLSGKKKIVVNIPGIRSTGYPAMMGTGKDRSGTASSGDGKDTSRSG